MAQRRGGNPFKIIKPSVSAVKGVITLFSHVLTTELRDGTTIQTVFRECDGPCRVDQNVVITQHLAMKMPGTLWFGCVHCGTQTLIRTDAPDELFELSPAEQKMIAEADAGITYHSKISERVRKRAQKNREMLQKKAIHTLERKNNPKLR